MDGRGAGSPAAKGATSGKLPALEDEMRLDFVGVDPDNPAYQCPAVFVDPGTGDFYM